MGRFIILGVVLANILIPPASANKDVEASLRLADMTSGSQTRGCHFVRLAIMEFNNPEFYGPSTVSRARLQTYADRCNLEI
jgi:hypothetical protein